MALRLRSELRRGLAEDIAELADAVTAPEPRGRDLVRLGLLREAQTLVDARRDLFPEIERIAVRLWQYGNGDHVSPMDLDPRTRRVMLIEAAVTYVIVHGTN